MFRQAKAIPKAYRKLVDTSSYRFSFVHFLAIFKVWKGQLTYVHYYSNHFVGLHIRTVLSQFKHRKQLKVAELTFVNDPHHVEHLLSPDAIKSVKWQTLLLRSSGVFDSFDDSIFKCKHKVADCITACARVWKQSEFRGAAQALKVCSVEVGDLRGERKQHAFNLVKSQGRRGFSF